MQPVKKLKRRICVLIAMLVLAVFAAGCALAKEADYSGRYVDTQGTDVVYSELKLKLLEDGSYHAEISIYRLAALEGTAVINGDMLLFEDSDTRVKGNIQILDGEAVFTIMESEFEYITPGERFVFHK